jgi:hypothetical protein
MSDSDDDVHGSAIFYRETMELVVKRVFRNGSRFEAVKWTRYKVSHLEPNPEIGSPAVRLTQSDGSSYDLIRTVHGWTCECPDFVNRRERKGLKCKHLKAVLKAGVLSEVAKR